MVKQIKLTHDRPFTCEYVINDKVVEKTKPTKEHIFSVTELPCKVKVHIQPYKITPLVRFDDILVNYGLAEITPWDHMLEFQLYEDFFDHYFNNIIKSKIKYLDLDKNEAMKKLGHEDLSDVLEKINENMK